MPHTKSAKKSLRQDQKRRDRNRAVKKSLKAQLKKFAAALKEGSAEQKQTEFVAVVKKLDKAAARRVIHPNAAARKKSQLARQLAAPAAK
jgi:small subunit ribosomal protein S20